MGGYLSIAYFTNTLVLIIQLSSCYIFDSFDEVDD